MATSHSNSADSTVKLKTCSLCKKRKPIAEFHKYKQCPDGLRRTCKLCNCARVREYREKYPERVAENKRRSAEKNKEQIAAYQKQWRIANTEKRREYAKNYKRRNRRVSTKEENIKRYQTRGRTQHLRRKFGINQSEYDRLIDKQNGRCAICGTNNPGRTVKNFHVDHCHNTGKVRGLLCARCNLGLGAFGDNPKQLMKAIRYLRQASLSQAWERELEGATA